MKGADMLPGVEVAVDFVLRSYPSTAGVVPAQTIRRKCVIVDRRDRGRRVVVQYEADMHTIKRATLAEVRVESVVCPWDAPHPRMARVIYRQQDNAPGLPVRRFTPPPPRSADLELPIEGAA